ncbi:hypothetical protein E8E14_005652 [Neopestalotiopsis sp. 37M]|nr:hypothetical protein E8E14_005652 [Neopestalotiopsis sp. 37M]
MVGTKKIGRGLRLRTPRHDVKSEREHTQPEYAGLADLISILQRSNIPILPVSPQQGLDILGRGMSGSVHQAAADALTMLAFKSGIPSRCAQDDNINHDWYSLITELTILNHPPIRNSLHCAKLLGITFIPDEENSGTRQTWPNLVTLKATLGNLEEFLTSHQDDLLTDSVRSTCVADITHALNTLHSCGVACGDVKPQNMLVRTKPSQLIACELIDFGSSVINGQQLMPVVSEPWEAPELSKRSGVSWMGFEDMVQTDLYSYGLVCVHLLVPLNQLRDAGITLIREQDQKIDDWERHIAEVRRKKILDDEALKFGNFLHRTLSEMDLPDSVHRMVSIIVENTILPEPGHRRLPHVDLEAFVTCSSECSQTHQNKKLELLQAPSLRLNTSTADHSQHQIVQLGDIIGELDDADFTIKANLADAFIRRAESSPCGQCRREFSFLAAVCQAIGISSSSINQLGHENLERSGKTEQDLIAAVHAIGDAYRYTGRIRKDVLDLLGMDILLNNSSVWQYKLSVRSETARAFLNSEITARETILGNNHLSLARLHLLLAELDMADDLFTSAAKTYERCVTILGGTFGNLHPSTITARVSLGYATGKSGQHERGVAMITKELKFFNDQFGRDHPDTLVAQTMLADMLVSSSDRAGAEAIVREVFNTRTKMLGSDHPLTVRTGLTLLNLITRQGRYFEELKLQKDLEQSLDYAVYGDYAFDAALSLALMYQQQGDLEYAEKVCRDALKRSKPTDTLRVLGIWDCLSGILHQMERVDAAEDIINTIFDSCKGTYLEPALLKTLADIQESRDQSSDILPLRERAYELLVDLNQPVEKQLLMKSLIMRRRLESEKLTTELEEEARGLIDRQKEFYSEKHPENLRTMLDLALALAVNKEFDRAQEITQDCMESLDGYHMKSQAPLLGKGAAVFYECHKFEMSEALERRALKIRESFLPAGHRIIRRTQTNLATSLIHRGIYVEAEKLLKQVLSAQTLAPTNDKKLLLVYARNKATLGTVYYHMKRFTEAANHVFEAIHDSRVYSLEGSEISEWKDELNAILAEA